MLMWVETLPEVLPCNWWVASSLCAVEEALRAHGHRAVQKEAALGLLGLEKAFQLWVAALRHPFGAEEGLHGCVLTAVRCL